MRLLGTSRTSAGNVPSCPLSLPLSPKPSCGIQGVGRGFSSRMFLLRAAKPPTSLPLPPRQHLPGTGTTPPAPLGSASPLLGPFCPSTLLRHHPRVCFSHDEWKVSIPGMCRPAWQAGASSSKERVLPTSWKDPEVAVLMAGKQLGWLVTSEQK